MAAVCAWRIDVVEAEGWIPIRDPEYVVKLVSSIQQGIVETSQPSDGKIGFELHAPDIANALMLLLASVLARSPMVQKKSGLERLASLTANEMIRLIKKNNSHGASQNGLQHEDINKC